MSTSHVPSCGSTQQFCHSCMVTWVHPCLVASRCLDDTKQQASCSIHSHLHRLNFVEFLHENAKQVYKWETVGRSLYWRANEWQIPYSSQQVINMHVRLRIAFSQCEADTRHRRLFVFIWWQLTAVFPFNKIRLKKLVVHSLICHLTEGPTWGQPYPIHSERLIRDSLIHRGPGSALTGCTCTKQQMGGWLVSVPEKPPLSFFSFIRGPQHICGLLLRHFLFLCLIKCWNKVTWPMGYCDLTKGLNSYAICVLYFVPLRVPDFRFLLQELIRGELLALGWVWQTTEIVSLLCTSPLARSSFNDSSHLVFEVNWKITFFLNLLD